MTRRVTVAICVILALVIVPLAGGMAGAHHGWTRLGALLVTFAAAAALFRLAARLNGDDE